MTTLITKLAGLGLAATVLLASCEKDEEKVMMQPATASGLTASAPSVVLLQANATKDAITYSWAPTTYGYQAAVSYTLQFDKKGGTFATPIEVEAGNTTSKVLTTAELNNVLLKLGMAAGNAGQVDVRVKSSVSSSVAPVYSSASTITATPYSEFVLYPQIYVPGSYQGWAPDKAPFLASEKSDEKYEGYLNFTDASTKFKFTPARNWDNDFGDDGTGAGLKAKGADIEVMGAGYYRFNVDMKALKYTYTKTTWAIIGSATPGDWNTETPMTYDAAKGVWTVTTTLKAGAELKFRANNAWDIDMGDKLPADGKPDYKGDNIKSPGAGTYTVTLDLSKGEGNYAYTINK